MRKKDIVVGVVLGILAGGYLSYSQQNKFSYYNDVTNFEAYASDVAQDFVLEDYHVTAPSYENVEEHNVALKARLEKMFPVGSDYKSAIYMFLMQKMVVTYTQRLVGNLAAEKRIYAHKDDIFNDANRRIMFLKVIKIEGVEKNPWHAFKVWVDFDKNGGVLRFGADIKGGGTKSEAELKWSI